jgi:hypothetical protein
MEEVVLLRLIHIIHIHIYTLHSIYGIVWEISDLKLQIWYGWVLRVPRYVNVIQIEYNKLLIKY